VYYVRNWGKSITCVHPESPRDHAVLWITNCKHAGISESLFVIMTFVWQHSQMCAKFSSVLRWVCKLIIITPMVLLYQSLEIPVTQKACQNALQGSDTLLKLMLLSYTPHPLRHSWRLPVTNMQFADNSILTKRWNWVCISSGMVWDI